MNNEQCKIGLALIDLSPIGLKYYYPVMIILDKCNGSCKADFTSDLLLHFAHVEHFLTCFEDIYIIADNN